MAPRLVLCVLLVSVTNLVMSQDMNQCMMKLQRCQMSVQLPSSQENIDPCSGQTPMDACTIYTKIADCVRVNLSSCMSITQIREAASTLFATKDSSCSPALMCPQKMSLCSCHLRKAQPMGGDVSPQSIPLLCAAFSEFEACVAENKECADNPQLKEGLATVMATYGSMCSKVMPQDMNQCMMKLQLCQMSVQPPSSQENIDPCSGQTPTDPCAIYTKIADCVRVNLSSCMSIDQIRDAASTLFATKDSSCSPALVCPQKLSLCSCHLRKAQPMGGEASPQSMSLLCAAFSEFEACIAENEECADNPQLKEGLATVMATYGSMCSKGQPKMCMEGMACMQEAMKAGMGSMSGSDVPSASAMCGSTEKVFDCLGAIKNPACGAEENDVTFEDIKENFIEACKDGLSGADALSQCKEYNTCVMKNNPAIVNASDPMRVFSDIGRTSFWCTFLVHSLSCASSTGDACSLPRDIKAKLAMHEDHLRETCDMETNTETESDSQTRASTAVLGKSSMLTTLMAIAVLLWFRV